MTSSLADDEALTAHCLELSHEIEALKGKPLKRAAAAEPYALDAKTSRIEGMGGSNVLAGLLRGLVVHCHAQWCNLRNGRLGKLVLK